MCKRDAAYLLKDLCFSGFFLLFSVIKIVINMCATMMQWEKGENKKIIFYISL